MAVKMTLAMVATALAADDDHRVLQPRTHAGARRRRSSSRNLEQLAQSTAGRISQLLGDSRNLADYVGTDDDFVAYLAKPTPTGTTATLAQAARAWSRPTPTSSSRW